MRTVSHWLHCGVKSDVVTSMQRTNGFTDAGKHPFWDTETQVRAMSILPVVNIHLHEDICRVVVQRHRVVLVVIDTSHVAIPSNSSAEKSWVEISFGFPWTLLECVIPASFKVIGPRHFARYKVAMGSVLDKDKHVDWKCASKNHDGVQNGSSGQNNADGADVPGKKFVF